CGKARRANYEPPFPRDRLEDDGCYPVRGRERFQEAMEISDAFLDVLFFAEAGRPVERVGKKRVVDLRGERAADVLVGLDLARQRHGQQGASVKGVLETPHCLSLGETTGNLDRVLHRLGTAVEKTGLLWAPPRHQLDEPFRQLDVRLIHGDLKAG